MSRTPTVWRGADGSGRKPGRRGFGGWLGMAALTVLFAGSAMPSLALAAKTGASPAAPKKETIRADVSTRKVAIESNFTGIQIVIFGAIDNPVFKPDSAPYDVVAVVQGPSENFIARRKERIAGIWINRNAETFHNVPGFYAVLSTRPLRAIASQETLNKFKIGFAALPLGPTGTRQDDEFRQAVIRLRQSHRLFQDNDSGIRFVGQTLFRGTVALPVNVPVGLYTTRVYLFRNGKFLSEDDNTLHVQKVGFERRVYMLALHRPLLYGLAGVAIALLMGLLAWALFRRE